MIESALRHPSAEQINCYEDKQERLLAELTLHGVDLVITDTPVSMARGSRVHNHLIGESAIAAFARPGVAKQYVEDFPGSLRHAPLMLQTSNTSLRRTLDKWFDDQGLAPGILAEIEDSALLKTFASEGSVVIFAPVMVKNEIGRLYGLGQLEKSRMCARIFMP